MNQHDQHQQHGGPGRNRGRNRGGGERGGGGGGGQNRGAINVANIPQCVVQNALEQIEVGELGDLLLARFEAEDRRAEADHLERLAAAEQKRLEDAADQREKAVEAALKRVQARQQRSLDLARGNAEINRMEAETAERVALAQTKAEDERRRVESASKASRQKAVALFAEALSAFTTSIPLGTFAREYRERLTTRFLARLSREALEHFRSAVVGTAQDATDTTTKQATHTLMMLARIKNDQERFQTARASGLLPEHYLREE